MCIRDSLSALLCLGVFPALSAELDLIQNASARQGVTLNGPWRVIVDPYESGYYDYRYKPQADGGFGANKKPQSKSDLIEYDFDTADRLQVPGGWNTQRPELMLYDGTVWYNGDFDCTIQPGPGTFVQDYSIQLEKGSQTRVAGWVRLNGAGRGQKVTVRIPEAGITQTFTPDATGLARVAFDARIDLWSPERPKLYDVTIESGADRVTDRIGFRTIEARGRNLLLNGKPVFLRGVSIHAEAPFRAGRVYSEADARTLFQWAKEVDCNFVRLPHYPHDE